MTLIDEIQAFSRDFINIKSFRTRGRKAKIREAYKKLTGKDIKISCNTCYLEALFEIINSKPMATRNYELKKGVLLQAFGDASKTCTNDTLTDALAEWYLKHYPEKAIYFSRMPGTVPVTPAAGIKIIPPVKKEEVKVEIIVPDKIGKEDQVKRKVLVDKALALGFKKEPESPIEQITSEELEIIIAGLEKAKEVKKTVPKKQVSKAKK